MTVPILHTIFQSLPNREYHLTAIPNVAFVGAWGLGMPPETTQDELVLERGVFQHGSNLAILKLPPTREYMLSFKINESCTLPEYFLARRKLIEIFNVVHIANGQTSGVVPRPFVYSIIIPDFGKYSVSLVYRDGLGFDANQALGHRANDVDVRVMSPSVWLWEDLIQEDLLGFTSAVGGPYNDILNLIAPFVYQGSWPARFRFEVENNGAAITTLYSIILRDVTSSFSYIFKHVDYPSGGWDFAGVAAPQTFVFDSIREIATYEDASGPGNDQNLVLAAHQDSDWRDFQFYPGNEYEIYLETDTALQIVSGTVADDQGFSYYPRHIGI